MIQPSRRTRKPREATSGASPAAITRSRGEGTIGWLARNAGVSVEAIRYYERLGVLPPAARTERGQRRYDETGLALLKFVRRARDLGFDLATIATLLTLDRDAPTTCGKCRGLAESILTEVRQRRARLECIERDVAAMIEGCAPDATEPCPVLATLSGDD
jgi:DNA-binding transcriptional MerR regulator